MDMYKKIKRQNGERFARALRDFHNGLLQIPDIDVIVRHAGRDAEDLLPYLMTLLDSAPEAPAADTLDPFELLDRAGYDAFYADTLEKQNSIARYFEPGELLCTFNNSNKDRHVNYHIIHAVKKDADKIRRKDFKGKEQRQDEYGTSVISIQIAKQSEFISIKNRYNHTVAACDNTFGSNPDNIYRGLSFALKNHFNVDFKAGQDALPLSHTLIGKQIFKYYFEANDFYYGDNAWAKDGVITSVNKSAGEAMFENFMFDSKTKTLIEIDSDTADSFAHDFNRAYGGHPGLYIKAGNLMLNGEVLIGAEESRITTLNLPNLKELTYYALCRAEKLETAHLPNLARMGEGCLLKSSSLATIDVPALVTMGNYCLHIVNNLKRFYAPSLESMGTDSLFSANTLTHAHLPRLDRMGSKCFYAVQNLIDLHGPKLVTMAGGCFTYTDSLRSAYLPLLKTMGRNCFKHSTSLTSVHVPRLTTMEGVSCFAEAPAMTRLRLSPPVRWVEGAISRIRPRPPQGDFTQDLTL